MDLPRLFESRTTRRTFLRVGAAAGLAAVAGVGLGTYRPRIARATGTEIVFDPSTPFSTDPVPEAVLFGWLEAAFPTQSHLTSVLHKAERYIVPGTSDNIVVPDVGFYGSVQYVPSEDKYKMWSYSGYYSESTDGFDWDERTPFTLPDPEGGHLVLTVLYDPDDTDPDRRYKMVYEWAPEPPWTDQSGRVAYSPDGLNWTPSSNNPIWGTGFEMQGIMKVGGTYYLNGQDLTSGFPRRLHTFTSTDFESWTGPAEGLVLDDTAPFTEQVHLGAALLDRNNITLGIYDYWQEPETGPGDPCPNFPSDGGCDVDIDLRLAVSYDRLTFFDAGVNVQLADDQGDPHDNPAITHGQGILNTDTGTLLFFGGWHMANHGMRLATWKLDRLGDLRKDGNPTTSVAISAPLEVQSGPAQLHANVDLNARGGGGGDLTFALLDGTSGSSAISGYSSGTISGSGYSQVVTWDGSTTALPTGQTFRIQATYGGSDPDDVSLFALYIGDRS